MKRSIRALGSALGVALLMTVGGGTAQAQSNDMSFLTSRVDDPCGIEESGMVGFSQAGIRRLLLEQWSRRQVCVPVTQMEEDVRQAYLYSSVLALARWDILMSDLVPDSRVGAPWPRHLEELATSRATAAVQRVLINNSSLTLTQILIKTTEEMLKD